MKNKIYRAQCAVPVKENIKKAGKENVITLLEGDALEIMPTLKDDSFDFVFMDAAKAQYINFLPHVLRLMKKWLLLKEVGDFEP